jgi:hypothetical protein
MPLTTYTSGEVLTAASLNANFAFAALGGKLGQIVSVDKLNTFSTSSTSYVDVTDWTATITPTAATSKVLVFYSTTASHDGNAWAGFQILRGATAIGNGTASGITSPANKAYRDGDSNGGRSVAGMFLDSPATTSATTYKIQVKKTAGTMVVGATYQGLNNADTYNVTTNITLMEILA